VRRWCLVLIAACALGLGSCDDDNGDGTNGGGGVIETSDTPPQRTLGEILQEAQDRAAREQRVLSDAAALSPLLNQFWANDLGQVHGIEFDPPDRFEYYKTQGNSPCGSRVEPMPRNAYYCPDDATEHVAFDLAWFQEYLEAHPGGATTFLVLAHEWGHAVQDSWLESGGNDVWNPERRQELNADCLAGVFLARSINDGTIIVEEGDEEAIFQWLYEAGSANWLDPGTHGTREERMTAFTDGVQGQDSMYCRNTY
jgi:predicted metalloprotease